MDLTISTPFVKHKGWYISVQFLNWKTMNYAAILGHNVVLNTVWNLNWLFPVIATEQLLSLLAYSAIACYFCAFNNSSTIMP